MPHALLLSPDDQAVTAITGVLEEMSVSCERPLDGVSAAQKLNSQSFDLVLVDCENLPAAKLIFDVCRRGKNGHNPVPIAIVDGRAGLPTAFRLGAELILTKPVSQDQARTTIRTAVSRVKKDPPVTENVPAALPGIQELAVKGALVGAVGTGAELSENDSPAIAAADVSPQLTSFAEPAPSFVSTSSPSQDTSSSSGVGLAAARARSAPALAGNAQAAENKIHVTAASPGLQSASPLSSPSTLPLTSLPLTSRSTLNTTSSPMPVLEPQLFRPAAVNTKPPLVMKPSDDPVLAELERAEFEEEELKNAGSAKVAAAAAAKVAPEPSPARVYASRPHTRPRRKGALISALMLALACGGFYAAWTYQPEFRAVAQPQVDRLFTMVGVALPPAEAPKFSGSSVASHPSASQSTPPPAAGDPGAVQTYTSAGVAAESSSPAAGPPGNSQLEAAKSGAAKADDEGVDIKVVDSRETKSAASTEARHLDESNAIILSSQGAQKRLVHSVQPNYPVEARSRGAQGTIVLKTVVAADGKVARVGLVEGNASLATAAIQAVKQWRYRPYVRDGKAQPFQTVVIVDFQRP